MDTLRLVRDLLSAKSEKTQPPTHPRTQGKKKMNAELIPFPGDKGRDLAALKLCRDCKFFNPDDEKCDHASALMIDYVRGEHKRFYASTQRAIRIGPNDCGEEAKWFEPRESAKPRTGEGEAG